jgi:uncharacterized protein
LTVRLVLDTNILISGLLSPSGAPGQLIDRMESDNSLVLVTAEEQLSELLRVARYPKLRSRLNPGEVDELIVTLRDVAVMVGSLPEVQVSPDPDDNFLLAIAQAGRADWLVTGDKRDLLSLGMHARTQILTARQALDRLTGIA